MTRTIQMTVSAERTDGLADALRQADGLIGLRVQRGISVEPPGDVIAAEVLDDDFPAIMQLLDERGVGRESGTSLVTSSPLSVLSSQHGGRIVRDTNESSLEEIEQIMGREAQPTINVLVLMAVAGALAVVGLSENSLHLVVAGMIIAPGFVPIVRGVFGGISRRGDVGRGVLHVAQTYAALVAGAGIAAVALIALGRDPSGSSGSYLPPTVLVSYWTTLTPMSVLVGLVAAAAGAIVITTNRAVLTAGVMVALALVPAASIVAIGIATADLPLAASGLGRWVADVVLVVVGSALVLAIKQRVLHRRRSLV